jgi:hypothetical protein
VRVHGEPPNVGTSVLVDGSPAGGTQGDLQSRAPLVNAGMFELYAGVSEQGGIVYGQVPLATASVEVTTDHGNVVSVCPVTVPTDDLIAWFGLSLPPGTRPVEARALNVAGRVLASGDFAGLGLDEGPSAVGTHMTVDPALVSLPLGGTALELPPPIDWIEIASGAVGSDAWTLVAGADGDVVQLELRFSDAWYPVLRVTPERLAGGGTTWYVQAVDGQLVVWGPVPPEVTTVTVALDDGTSTDISPVATVPDTPVQAFAGALPPGSTVTGIEGHRSDGTTVMTAIDVAETTAALSGPDAPPFTGLEVVSAR